MEAGVFWDNSTIRMINFYKLFTDSVIRKWTLARKKVNRTPEHCEFNIQNTRQGQVKAIISSPI